MRSTDYIPAYTPEGRFYGLVTLAEATAAGARIIRRHKDGTPVQARIQADEILSSRRGTLPRGGGKKRPTPNERLSNGKRVFGLRGLNYGF